MWNISIASMGTGNVTTFVILLLFWKQNWSVKKNLNLLELIIEIWFVIFSPKIGKHLLTSVSIHSVVWFLSNTKRSSFPFFSFFFTMIYYCILHIIEFQTLTFCIAVADCSLLYFFSFVRYVSLWLALKNTWSENELDFLILHKFLCFLLLYATLSSCSHNHFD